MLERITSVIRRWLTPHVKCFGGVLDGKFVELRGTYIKCTRFNELGEALTEIYEYRWYMRGEKRVVEAHYVETIIDKNYIDDMVLN